MSAPVQILQKSAKILQKCCFPLDNTAFWHRFSLANFGVREVFDGTRVFGGSGTEEDRWKLPLVYSIPVNMLKQL